MLVPRPEKRRRKPTAFSSASVGSEAFWEWVIAATNSFPIKERGFGFGGDEVDSTKKGKWFSWFLSAFYDLNVPTKTFFFYYFFAFKNSCGISCMNPPPSFGRRVLGKGLVGVWASVTNPSSSSSSSSYILPSPVESTVSRTKRGLRLEAAATTAAVGGGGGGGGRFGGDRGFGMWAWLDVLTLGRIAT